MPLSPNTIAALLSDPALKGVAPADLAAAAAKLLTPEAVTPQVAHQTAMAKLVALARQNDAGHQAVAALLVPARQGPITVPTTAQIIAAYSAKIT